MRKLLSIIVGLCLSLTGLAQVSDGTLNIQIDAANLNTYSPSAMRSLLHNFVGAKLSLLGSGTSIKTVNGSTLLGAGNLSVGTVTTFTAGDFSPLFTSSVATGTSTPALSFVPTPGSANTLFGVNTGATGFEYKTVSNGLIAAAGTLQLGGTFVSSVDYGMFPNTAGLKFRLRSRLNHAELLISNGETVSQNGYARFGSSDAGYIVADKPNNLGDGAVSGLYIKNVDGLGLSYTASPGISSNLQIPDVTYVRGAKTFTGKQTFIASDNTTASLNIQTGTLPDIPLDGDVWETTGGVFFQISTNSHAAMLDGPQVASYSVVGNGIRSWHFGEPLGSEIGDFKVYTDGQFLVSEASGPSLAVTSFGVVFNGLYTFPAGNSIGALTNDGSGNLFWTTSSGATWGSITGLVSDQTDLVDYIASQAPPIATSSNDGLLSASDWSLFNGKLSNVLTTTGGMIYSSSGTTAAQLSYSANGKFLTGAAGVPTWSTSTIPTSAGATANKVLLSNGTNYVLSTPTFPNASATSGKIIVSDGTNWIASTPTFPNASATTRKIIVSDGTNWNASTETYAVPGTTGNVLTSDGTNWTSAAPAAGSSWALTGTSTLTGAATIVGTTTNIVKFTTSSLGTTLTDGAGLWLQNTTAAAAGAQQNSPYLTLEGNGWKTNATAGSQSVKFTQYVNPAQGSANPTGSWALAYSVNGAAYTNGLMVTSSAGGTSMPFFDAGGLSVGGIGFARTPVFGQMQYSASLTIGGQSTASVLTLSQGKITVTQQSLGSAWVPMFAATPGTHTSMTASTEFPDFTVEAATHTWAAGTITTQRWHWLKVPTIAFASASTLTNAYALYVDAPAAGTNATITNNWAVGVAGNLKVTGSRVNMASLPTASAGLAMGDLWNNSGVINIIP